MTNIELKNIFLEKLGEKFGSDVFTIQEAKDLFEQEGLGQVKKSKDAFGAGWIYVHTHILCKNKTTDGSRGKYCLNTSVENIKKETKKSIKKDLEIIQAPVVSPVVETEKVEMKSVEATVMNLIPKKDPTYVTFGHFKDVKSIIESKIFYPIFITGLSGNGKTSMVREVCAKLKRDMVRVNITVETDEDDLLGGFR